MCGRTKFLTFLTIVSFIQLAEQTQQCVPSTCGHIHNISYPFRLKTDPKHCGHDDYELSCEGNRTLLSLRDYFKVAPSMNFYVQAINYDNSTVHLVDPNIREVVCSLPQHPNSFYHIIPRDPRFRTYKFHLSSYQIIAVPITIFSCPFAITSSVSVEITDCFNTSYVSNDSSYIFKGHLYATMDNMMSPYDLRIGCSVELETMTSWPAEDSNYTQISLLDLHNALAYGFELSWFNHVYCQDCRGSCYGENSRDYRCVDYRMEYNFGIFKIHVERRLVHRIAKVINPWMFPIFGHIVATRIILLPCIFVFLMLNFRRRHLSIFDAIESFLHGENNLVPIRYSYSNIKKMTRNFKVKLGQGGYGTVYKGKLQSGPNVAVKILSNPKDDGQDFINEVATIGRIHHVNVVELVGYCAERSKRALVYDFMPNGSLNTYIVPREGESLLSWQRKSDIALGVAQGIEYLHKGCDIQILHFDIKPHNILLDENFVPKLSDFGLAKLSPPDKSIVTLTAARGTIGYVAPELINRSIGPISYKADVYSFGMLLVEMVGLKRNLEAREDASSRYFPLWIYDQFNYANGIEVDKITNDDEEKEIGKKLTVVALWCIQMNPLDRPSMTKVVEMLEGEVEALQIPSRPSQLPSYELNMTSYTTSSTESMKLLDNCSGSEKLDVIVG